MAGDPAGLWPTRIAWSGTSARVKLTEVQTPNIERKGVETGRGCSAEVMPHLRLRLAAGPTIIAGVIRN